MCLHPLLIGSTFGTCRLFIGRGRPHRRLHPLFIWSTFGTKPTGRPWSGAPFGGLHPLFIGSTFETHHGFPRFGAGGPRLHPLFIGSTFGTRIWGSPARPTPKSPSPLHRVNLRDSWIWPMNGWSARQLHGLHPLFIGSTFGTGMEGPRDPPRSESPSPLHRVNLRDSPIRISNTTCEADHKPRHF